MRSMRRPARLLLALLAVGSPTLARADPCPVGLVVTVDNDTPGSGYSEESPENWQSHNVEACQGTYRYLSKYVGDGSTDGKAVWQPTISVSGVYRVTTSFRASANRTDDADYTAYDDVGGSQKKVVSQLGGGCTEAEIADIYCLAGGTCRLVLDGTDDMKSDAADVTTFELLSCDPLVPPEPGRCDGIRAVPAYEVCDETDTTCKGVFTDGAGCVAYCAAAGMDCVASYGGEPGCMMEANTPLPCDPPSGHASDWCECAGRPLPGTGGAGGAGGGGGATTGAGGMAGTGGWAPGGGGAGGLGPSGGGGGAGAGSASPGGSAGDAGGCGCGVAGEVGSSRAALGLFLAAALLTLPALRRQAPPRARAPGAKQGSSAGRDLPGRAEKRSSRPSL
jgi:hypothetical protein